MLVFLPGLLCDARVFAPQAAAFPDALVVDGYGLADSLPEMARHVMRLLDERGETDPVDLFGHSMGGRVAMEVLRLAPERVQRLALASCGLEPADAGEPEKRAAIQRIGYEQGFDALVATWMKILVPAEKREEAYAAALAEMCGTKGQALFDAHNRALLARPPFADLLSVFNGPLLSLVGEKDRMAPVIEHERIAALAAHGMLEVLPATGHMVTLEAPDAVNTAIARWLAT